MDILISPPQDTEWRMDTAQFAKALHQAWMNIHVRFVENPASNHLLEWKVPLPGHMLEGALSRSRQAVLLDGDVYDCAQFALWVRKQVPVEQPLVFYDEGYSADVVLESSTTVEDLVQPFIR